MGERERDGAGGERAEEQAARTREAVRIESVRGGRLGGHLFHDLLPRLAVANRVHGMPVGAHVGGVLYGGLVVAADGLLPIRQHEDDAERAGALELGEVLLGEEQTARDAREALRRGTSVERLHDCRRVGREIDEHPRRLLLGKVDAPRR